MKLYYLYILSSVQRVLYVGVTGNFGQRLAAHRSHSDRKSFTSRCNVTRLVYYETYTRPQDAIAREKQLKRWARAKKLALIEQANPDWQDLAEQPEPTARTCSRTGGW